MKRIISLILLVTASCVCFADKLDSLEYSGTWFFELQELLMHGFIGYTSQSEITLSSEVDGAQWSPLEKLEDYMYPDSPGNAQFGTYQVYLQRYGR